MLRQGSFQYVGWGTQRGRAQQDAKIVHCREKEGTDTQPSLRGDGNKHSWGLRRDCASFAASQKTTMLLV